MGVVRTDKWLQAYVKSYGDKMNRQQKWIIEPLCSLFQTDHVDSLQAYLWQLGLFTPDQLVSEEDIDTWLQLHPWSIVKQEYERLRKKWDGPACKIYILPLIDEPPPLLKKLGEKTGITLSHAIVLLIKPTITKEQLRALTIHEYHHVCRLAHTKENEEKMTLLESICMEGLAEWAVKEELGKQECAVWTRYYDEASSIGWFDHFLKPFLYKKGRKAYHTLLYGDPNTGVPLWLGYYVGFKLIESAANQYISTKNMLTVDASSLYKCSSYFKTER
ncbi:DUF2268 domain-containing protein [Halalkalibacter sp. APA_J-10(15)]|uniref:DUF2268 domain-containing protein n=1 Tax=unclassified Halalkalibacter TaxID=2893063 RepID=UPI001FF5192E|nr:DUF2268 domain-containing putative Zn-dependent protease [Halalkalibacter sp. APA_J-10(15)]MCK0472631.1 DUF2268 domain-containing protein [Halalkalibacter sp. APA_J-10(15)]